MKTWTIAANNLPECRKGSVVCIERPWFVSLLDWAAAYPLGYPTSWLHKIKFPDWFKRARDPDYPDELDSLRDWYGDLGVIWWMKVPEPLMEWCHKHSKEHHIEIGYDKLKVEFYEDSKDYFNEMEEI